MDVSGLSLTEIHRGTFFFFFFEMRLCEWEGRFREIDVGSGGPW